MNLRGRIERLEKQVSPNEELFERVIIFDSAIETVDEAKKRVQHSDFGKACVVLMPDNGR